MSRRPLLFPVALVAAAMLLVVAAGLGAPTATAQEPPAVDAAVQVTRTPSAARAHAVPAVAVHPDDARIIAIGEADAYTQRCTVHVSTDAGLGWTPSPLPEPEGYPSCVYANFGPIVDVTFGQDGILYVAYSGHDPATYHQRMFLARSSDLGRTFDTTALPWVEPDLETGQFGADALPSVVVDPNRPSRVYVGWMSNNGTWNLSEAVLEGQEYFTDIKSRPYVAVSEDRGETFSEPVDAAGELQGWFSEPHLAVGNDGDLFAFFGENVKAPEDAPEGAEAPPARLHVATSEDGGKSFSQSAVHTRPAQEDSDWLAAPSPGVDRASGDLYVVWEETADGPPQVLFVRSDDAGASWSEPLRLNDVEPQREWTYNEFFPALDVAPDGRIDVAWYDWRNDVAFSEDGGNRFQDVFYTYSNDGGHSWADDIRITDRLIDRSFGVAETYGIKGPVGLASTGPAAFVAWDDTRNSSEDAQSQDIYFSRARFSDPGEVFAAATAAGDNRLLWTVLGAGAALALGGLVLAGATRAASRRPSLPEARRARAPAGR